MYRARDFADAVDKADALVRGGGLGHTSSIYLDVSRGQEKLARACFSADCLLLPLLSLRWCLQQRWDLLQITTSIPGPSRPRFPPLSNLWVSLRWLS